MADLANPAWAAAGQTMVDVGNVPLREFDGNVAFASADGLETWFTLLNVSGKFADQRNVISNFTTFAVGGRGIFTPYTALTTLMNVTVTGNMNSPGGTAFARNDVTRDMVYDHVYATGWDIGIDTPVNGTTQINGGFFNDVRGVFISTANSRNRTVNINGNTDAAGNLDPSQPQFGTLSTTALRARTQYEVALSSNFNPKENDITRLFNPDVIQMGMVTINDQQLYYKQQAADFKPFDSSSADGVASYVPAAFVNLTNQQLWDQYGLAIGGIVAPVGATASNPRIDALIGPHATYLPDLQLLSKKYVNQDNGPYLLTYKYFNPSDPTASKSGYVTVKETAPTALVNGWNVITRQVMGHVRTLLVYGDNIIPTFVLGKNVPTTINQADINNGSMFYFSGDILDDSFGSRHFDVAIRLNDPLHASAIQSDATGMFIILTFTIKDLAGNATSVSIRFTVATTSTLIKDIGRKNLPTIQPSITLQALLSAP